MQKMIRKFIRTLRGWKINFVSWVNFTKFLTEFANFIPNIQ